MGAFHVIKIAEMVANCAKRHNDNYNALETRIV